MVADVRRMLQRGQAGGGLCLIDREGAVLDENLAQLLIPFGDDIEHQSIPPSPRFVAAWPFRAHRVRIGAASQQCYHHSGPPVLQRGDFEGCGSIWPVDVCVGQTVWAGFACQ